MGGKRVRLGYTACIGDYRSGSIEGRLWGCGEEEGGDDEGGSMMVVCDDDAGIEENGLCNGGGGTVENL